MGIWGGLVVQTGHLCQGARGSLAHAFHLGRHVREWNLKAAVCGAQEKRVLLWDEGARAMQLGCRDMLWEDGQVFTGATWAVAGPPPGHRVEGQRPADAQNTSCHGGHGLTASGQEDGVAGSSVSDDSGMHCTLLRKVWKHTANQKFLGYLGMPLPPPGCLAISQSPCSGPLSAQAAAVWGLRSPGTCLGPGCTPREMHVGSATTPPGTWCGRSLRSLPGNRLPLSLPRLWPCGPLCSRSACPEPRELSSMTAAPSVGTLPPGLGPPGHPACRGPSPLARRRWAAGVRLWLAPLAEGCHYHGPPARQAGQLPPAPGAPSFAHLHAPTRPSGPCQDCRVLTSQAALGLWAPWAAGGAGLVGVGTPLEGQERRPHTPGLVPFRMTSS